MNEILSTWQYPQHTAIFLDLQFSLGCSVPCTGSFGYCGIPAKTARWENETAQTAVGGGWPRGRGWTLDGG